MADGFDTPQDFLQYCKFLYSRRVFEDSSVDAEFQALNEKQRNELGVSLTEAEIRTYAPLVQELEKHYSSLSGYLNTEKFAKVAIGAVERGQLNAFCMRSDDRKYAVLINYGLFLFLNKAYKLRQAIVFPRNVVYCSAGDPSKFTSSDYIKLLEELTQNYRQHRIPFGARLKVDEFLLAGQSHFLMAGELFILCHELAHVFLGHLEDERLVSRFASEGTNVLSDSPRWAAEHAADQLGYVLLHRILQDSPYGRDWRIVVLALHNLFEIISTVESSESMSHPPTMARFARLLRHFHGDNVAQAFSSSDPKARADIMRRPAPFRDDIRELSGASNLIVKAPVA